MVTPTAVPNLVPTAPQLFARKSNPAILLVVFHPMVDDFHVQLDFWTCSGLNIWNYLTCK